MSNKYNIPTIPRNPNGKIKLDEYRETTWDKLHLLEKGVENLDKDMVLVQGKAKRNKVRSIMSFSLSAIACVGVAYSVFGIEVAAILSIVGSGLSAILKFKAATGT